MLMTLVSALPSMAAGEKADKRPKLVKRVTVQKYDNDTKRWETTGTDDFTYNKHGFMS